ncbi:MAG: hypothetical protein QX199_15785 [Methylococcaceae bacterium]
MGLCPDPEFMDGKWLLGCKPARSGILFMPDISMLKQGSGDQFIHRRFII